MIKKMFEINKEKTWVKTTDYDYIVNSFNKALLDNPYTIEKNKGMFYYFEKNDNETYMKSIVIHYYDIENVIYTLLYSGKNIWFDLPYEKDFANKKANPPSLKKREMDGDDMVELCDWMGGENSKHGPMHGILLGLSAIGSTKTMNDILENEFTCNMSIDNHQDFSMRGISEDPYLLNLSVNDLIKDYSILNRKISEDKPKNVINNSKSYNSSIKSTTRPEDDYTQLFKEILNEHNIKYGEIKITNPFARNFTFNDISLKAETEFVFVPCEKFFFQGVQVETKIFSYPYTKSFNIEATKKEIAGHINIYIDRIHKQYKNEYLTFISNACITKLRSRSGISTLSFIIQSDSIKKDKFLK